MIPWWVVLAGFVVGVGSAALVAEFGWILQRAENGRGTPRPTSAQRCASPYDWAEDERLFLTPTREQIQRLMDACPTAEGFEKP